GATGGRVSLSMITNPALNPPYADVSQLLATFNRDLFFKDAYLPSIGKSVNENGETTLSFVFNLNYVEPDVGGSVSVDGVVPETDENRIPVNRVPTAPIDDDSTAGAGGETPRVPTNAN